MKKLIELNHPLEDGMGIFPGLPSPKIGSYLDHDESRSHYDGQAEFYISRIDMVCSLGTYLDSPFHRHRNGADLNQIPLSLVAGLPGIAFDAKISANRLLVVDCRASQLNGRAVLFRTGWDQRWGTDGYWEPGPYLSDELIGLLISSKASMVGVDFGNVDDILNLSRPAHTRLLAAGVLIVENLCNLAALPPSGFSFYAVPPRIVRGASFPVRAFAQVEV